MTSSEIRQSFLDFFREKQHTIVSSSSLLPDSPNLLFTNAGMNQFVPIFLGQTKCPYSPGRAADTQKCIRAGGKHNDLEDVGLDTYHHTFFEMLGNWSFGDYFKREAIDWAWELVVNRWGFPPDRLYATYFGGDDGVSHVGNAARGKIPADTEARDLWLRYLPANQIVPGNRKDNFWMMGDTGPCGPCSEIHVDLTPNKTGASLVNAGSPHCIEIWNLVFIQFNANADGSLSPLPAKHVDTGMGFERVCGILQCTDGFKDFTRPISNYNTDVFSPIFRELEKLSGKQYKGTLPSQSSNLDPQSSIDIAFRVIADHIRCLSFSIADGILPSNEGRGYVLRRILRRAIRYGRNLGFQEPFFYKLTDVVAGNFGDVFPELHRNKARIEKILRGEEESFNRTLDTGIWLFNKGEELLTDMKQESSDIHASGSMVVNDVKEGVFGVGVGIVRRGSGGAKERIFSGEFAFKLYDTYGFPLDLTELMARERGVTVDVAGFEKLMEEQRRRAREDHEKKKSIVSVVSEGLKVEPTKFIGYENLEAEAVVEAAVMGEKNELEFILDKTPCYAEMGGQVGDTGFISVTGVDESEVGRVRILDTQRKSEVHVHRSTLTSGRAPEVGEAVRVVVDAARRANIQRHHTVTHLFHWALHEVVNRDARQRGSLVAPDHLRFDFNNPERLTAQQIADVEKLVNERIRENAPVFWFEVPYAEIKGNPKVQQFFGEKYGEIVRVVQVGGHDGQFDGFSVELCGGTHTKTTGDIGLFKIARESAIAAGIRRIEAHCGQFATEFIEKQKDQARAEIEKQKAFEQQKELAKKREAELRSKAPAMAEQLLAKKRGNLIVENLGEASSDLLRAIGEALKPKLPSGIVVLGGTCEGKVALVCLVTPDLVKAGKHAGKIIGEIAKLCGGSGGGRPDFAQAGGKDPSKLADALAAVAKLV